jgi:hypothetical protein
MATKELPFGIFYIKSAQTATSAKIFSARIKAYAFVLPQPE